MILQTVTSPPGALLFQIAVMFIVAKVASELAIRFGGVALVGEIIAGAALGPHGVGMIQDNELAQGFAELGIVVLLFSVGVETGWNQLRVVGARGAVVGSVGIVLPFIGGLAMAVFSGYQMITALFV